MGALLMNKDSPIAVGKVTIYTTYLGTNKNGDIIVDVCTRFSYPNLYNDRRSNSLQLCSPSQQIDVSAKSKDTTITCCDLYKVNSQDLEFHMQIVLKNYDPSCKSLDRDANESADMVESSVDIDLEPNSSSDTRNDLFMSKGKHDEQHPYVFACCEDNDNEESIDTFETVQSATDDLDPLEFVNRMSPELIINEYSDEAEEIDESTMIGVEDRAIEENEMEAETNELYTSAATAHLTDDETNSSNGMNVETEKLGSIAVSTTEKVEESLLSLEVPRPLHVKARRGRPPLSSKTFVPPNLPKTKDGKVCSIEGLRVERSKKYENSQRARDKKTRCVFCHDDVDHFSRHLLRKHKKEKDVLAFSRLPKESKQRALLIGALRKRGNFTKITDNIISPVRRPREGERELFYQACNFCQGLYNAKYLRRHLKRCPLYSEEEIVPTS